VIGSEAAGRTAAVLYTLVGTCKHLSIDPLAYLREALPGLFTLGEKPTAEQLLDWLPDRWLLRRGRESPGEAQGQRVPFASDGTSRTCDSLTCAH
jgi:transposase